MGQPLDNYSDRRCNVGFTALQCLFWIMHSSYYSFFIPFLQSKGFSGMMIGLVYTVHSTIAIILPLVYGYICDFWLPAKRLVLVGISIAIPLAFMLKFTVAILPLAFVAIVLMAAVERSMPSVVDGWGMKLVGQGVDLNFGLSRGAGSLGYAVAALLLGRFYDRAGQESMFWVHAILAGCFLVAAILLPEVPVAGTSRSEKLSFAQVFALLMKNRDFVVFIICAIFTSMCHSIHSTFLPMLIGQMGGTSSSLGLYWFVLAASEFPMMSLSRRILSRFPARRLLCFCMWFLVLRAAVPFFVPNIGWLIGVQVMQAISFGLFLPTWLQYVSEITDRRMIAMAITIGAACTEGLPGIIGNLLGGFLSDRVGVRAVFLVFAGFIFAGALAFTLLSVRGRPATANAK